MGLLCNMARSAECSALMLEHGVIALVAASLLHHQVQRVASGAGYVLWLFGLASGCLSLFGHLQHGIEAWEPLHYRSLSANQTIEC